MLSKHDVAGTDNKKKIVGTHLAAVIGRRSAGNRSSETSRVICSKLTAPVRPCLGTPSPDPHVPSHSGLQYKSWFLIQALLVLSCPKY